MNTRTFEAYPRFFTSVLLLPLLVPFTYNVSVSKSNLRVVLDWALLSEISAVTLTFLPRSEIFIVLPGGYK
jgi:hypothetical protein